MNIIPIERVTEKTSLGRSSIYAYSRDGRFPPSVKLGARLVGWVEAEVDAWLSERVKERDTKHAEEVAA